mmetsp:Transcript_6001/g.15942  ORF Transcript_6001/g.15942 Transcript_6001/m.15942 type:complete len:89 (-) Transcript_6001:818-1084(-)|eukprot:CAMPEP_0185829474 /NCGR_PEP_ID=MMETSP1353-20130828/272_1 /TAXON_ID=1077150 /ORGANISM="Erythrolobus australicus, Strain CCMP3124" /LENGTH=88 /DNA_ID=CAMNT_0028527273 /DNA_START=50 /DNA_END=316 /DNA_ORIENTATION=-
MSEFRLFVGNLAWATTDESLKGAFAEAVGEENVMDAKVIMDRYTGRSRGFGFVSLASQEAAQKAVEVMNGANVDGREVRVDHASSRDR